VTLCLLGTVLRRCSPPSWQNDDRIQLTVKPGASVSFDDLRKLQGDRVFTSQISDAALQSKFDKNEPGDLPPGVSFTLTLPRTVNRAVVARNLADLVSIDSATWRMPQAYFLIEESFCFDGSLEGAPEKVRRYHNAIRLWKRLGDNAEHTTASGSLLFFGRRRTEIRPGFDLNDLAEDIAVEEVEQFLDNQERPEIRKNIFRSAIEKFLRDQKVEKAFSYLLRSTGPFAQRLNEHWKTYISNYSPDKANRQAVIKHLEFTEKLEKIISGMEAKSLTIPAAVLLAVKEVQFGAGWTTLNTMILTASVLYLLAMAVAHLSQSSTLKLLKTTIDKTTKDLKEQGLKEDNSILTDSFVNLESRRKSSSYGSWAMFGVSFVPLIAVVYAAFWASPAR
jgi:hypothetical protein